MEMTGFMEFSGRHPKGSDPRTAPGSACFLKAAGLAGKYFNFLSFGPNVGFGLRK